LELLLKQSRARAFLQWIKAHPEEMLKLLERRYGLSGIVYILQVENRFSSEEIEAAIVSISPSKKEETMNVTQAIK